MTDPLKQIAMRPCSANKDRYESQAEAYGIAANRVGPDRDKPEALRAYHCPECDGWHFTV